MSKYVIVGNGIAAAGCIEGIRSADPDGKITVVSEEKHPVYCRPLISYYLEGKSKLENIGYRHEDFYEKNGCGVLYGRKAEKLDAEKKCVTLDDGETVSYDKLCVAAGSSPFVPPFGGLDSVEKSYSFMTLDDALVLEKDVTPDSRVFIVGAGLIGLKCAEGLCGRAKSITVCDLADRILSSILDAETASFVQTHLEEAGLRFLLSDSVVKFEKDKAHMKSGITVEFDILVLAVGVRANTSLIREAGGEVDRGIIVDTGSRTSIPDVYAAGDCAQGFDLSLGGKRVLALLPNAYMQGRCAGVNMAGGNEDFSNAIPMNSMGLFGWHIMTAGGYDGGCFKYSGTQSITKLYTKDGYLTGFILVNDTERAGIYTSMIRNRVPLESVNFELLKKSATTAAFSSETRDKMFGGVI